MVPDVSVVLVSPPSVVTECFGDVSLDSDWELVQPQSSSLSKKRAYFWTVSQYESSPVQAPPQSSRMMPPTPQQSSPSSIEERQWQIEEDQIWNARDRTVIAGMEQHLEKVTA